MRAKKVFKRICVQEDVYKRLIKDRKKFQREIAGGKWSISDTISEYHKILKTLKQQDK